MFWLKQNLSIHVDNLKRDMASYHDPAVPSQFQLKNKAVLSLGSFLASEIEWRRIQQNYSNLHNVLYLYIICPSGLGLRQAFIFPTIRSVLELRICFKILFVFSFNLIAHLSSQLLCNNNNNKQIKFKFICQPNNYSF